MSHPHLQSALHRYFYGSLKPPELFEVEKSWKHGFFRFSTNGWHLKLAFWWRWTGGFSLTYQAITWVAGWAKWGMMSGITIYGPHPNIQDAEMLPIIARHERWSNIVTERQLDIVLGNSKHPFENRY